MHDMAYTTQRRARLTRGVIFITLTLLALFAVQFKAATPAAAQDAAVPTDPLSQAYAAVRDALEEKYSTDLSVVTRWTFEELEFPTGIDSCMDLGEDVAPRALFWGWRFVITSLTNRRLEGRSSFDRSIIIACDRVEAPAQTAAPNTAVDPNLPAPVAGSAAIGGFELGGHVLELNANTVGLMRRSRMSWVKKQLRYSLGQDPSSAAGLIQSARANGFKIILGIVGDPTQMGSYDSYIASYASFVGGVAALGVDAIEVWNEPNIDREWPAGQINGGTYTRLLAAAYNAIKTTNPAVLVISGAPAPTGFFGSAGCAAGGCNDDAFMSQMAQAGAASYWTASVCITTKALSRPARTAVIRVAVTRPISSAR